MNWEVVPDLKHQAYDLVKGDKVKFHESPELFTDPRIAGKYGVIVDFAGMDFDTEVISIRIAELSTTIAIPLRYWREIMGVIR